MRFETQTVESWRLGVACALHFCSQHHRGRAAMRAILWTSIALAIGVDGTAGHADEKAYLIVFASQRENRKLPRFAHTFATFVQIGKAGGKERIETQTISWLPQSMKIAPKLRPEAGRNVSLPETLKWVEAQGERVIAWGPFQVKKELYDLAQAQVQRLEKGGIGYRMIDGKRRP